MTIEDQARSVVDASPYPVLLTRDFRDCGSLSQVQRALRALVADKLLVRIGLGLYAKTRISSVTGDVIPAGSLETLAAAALERLRIDAGPGRVAREYNSGQSNQLPGFFVVSTGRRRIQRVITVGGRRLVYEHD